MIFENTNIEGLVLIKPSVFEDERGYFFESFKKETYSKAGMNHEFVQDNISKSCKGTLRGLHFQIGDYAQGKLCQVLTGAVLDVAVDLRFNSPTFGKHFSVELSDANHYQLWIPAGFAHGFSVLSESAIFHYKCTAVYYKAAERAIIFNDENLGINWQVENPIISPKDLEAQKFNKNEKYFLI